VRVPPSDPAEAVEGAPIAHRAGEEIWQIDVTTGQAARRVSIEDLTLAGLIAIRYTLRDLAWSPAGDRLAFTWLDGTGWGQVAFASADGSVVPLPAPVMSDPWEKGALFDLSGSQFLWDSDGKSGTFVGWDEECGSLYRAAAPAPGSWPGVPVRPPEPGAAPEEKGPSGEPLAAPPATPEPLPLPSGCRPFLLGMPGFWLVSQFGEEFTQEISIVRASGEELETLALPEGRPPRVRWGGPRGGGRPSVIGWWRDEVRRERILFEWSSDLLTEWRREPCPSDRADPLMMTSAGILFLDGPPEAARLALLPRPGASPQEILAAPVEEIVVSSSGRTAVAVRGAAKARSLWLIDLP